MSCAIQASTVGDISVVCEFPYVFPDELPGLPPDRMWNLKIELVPGTTPISRRPYRMPPNELAKLKIQLQELALNELVPGIDFVKEAKEQVRIIQQHIEAAQA